MQIFTPDSTKLLHSRLWCWGTLLGSIVAFTICSVVVLTPETRLLWYLTAILVVNATLVVYLAERDYKYHQFSLSQTSISAGHQTIPFNQLDQLTWQIAPFPQTDNGGCRFRSGDTTIDIRFNYLSDYDAIVCFKSVRQIIPLELQRNWPEFCHTTALRLHNQMHQPGRELPPPEREEQQSLKESNTLRERFLLGFIVGGFFISLVVGALLERLGIPNSMPWCLGIFMVTKMFAQPSMVINRPVVERKYHAAQQIWQTEVVDGTSVGSNAPVA